MAGKTFCAMDMDMNLRPCPLIGETYQGGIRKAWQAMRKYRDDSLLPAACAGCIRHSVCGGGCKAEASASCGGMDRVDPYANVGNRSLLEPLAGPREFPIADGMYRLDPHLLYREEDFGGLLYLDTARYLPVGKQLYRFCIENRECGFSLAAALNNIKADPQGLRSTMGYLLSQGFLQAAQRKMDSYVEFFR
jgi:radical SAM protein with 4Fe4S-binding SPASM domain